MKDVENSEYHSFVERKNNMTRHQLMLRFRVPSFTDWTNGANC